MRDASDKLVVKRSTLYHYIHALKLETFRFPLDRQSYLRLSDFEKIRALKEQAATRSSDPDQDDAALPGCISSKVA
jgi:hypothetical protein